MSCYENKLTFPIYFSDQKFENSMDLILVTNGGKIALYVYQRFMFHKTKNKYKNHFCKSCLQCFNSRNMLAEHKKVCVSINGGQSVRLEKGAIEFKNYFKQIPVPLKIYDYYECNLKGVESYKGSYSKKYQDRIPCSFAHKLACVGDKFSKAIVVFRGKNAAYKFIEAILKEFEYCKKHFNKNLIMSEEEEEFQPSNTCWICEKLINDDDEKVRDHFHVTSKLKGVAHLSCNKSSIS